MKSCKAIAHFSFRSAKMVCCEQNEDKMTGLVLYKINKTLLSRLICILPMIAANYDVKYVTEKYISGAQHLQYTLQLKIGSVGTN